MIEVVHAAAQDPVELIEAVPDGPVLREIAQVPLADQRRRVARPLEQRCRGGMLRREPDTVVAVGERLGQPDGKASGISAGHEGDPGRGADRGRGVVAGEAESFPGEPIEMGRAIVRPAVAAQVAIAEVVRQNKQDVGRPGPRPTKLRERRVGGSREAALEKVAS